MGDDIGMRLSGKTAIVTGAGRGIGEAIAMAFAREDCSLVLASRTKTELEAVAQRARDRGARAEVVVADVAKTADVARLAATAFERFGTVDLLVNNAGVYGPIGRFTDVDVDEWWRAIETNLRGALLCIHAVAPAMIAAGRGKIINMSGGGAASPLPRLTAYSVSKTAVVRLTENLAEELRPHNVQVNAIAPGAVDTRLQDQLLEAGEQAAGELYGRIRKLRDTGAGGVPPTVAAELALFLATSGSDHVTGRLISAPHDPWRDWFDAATTPPAPMFTLRRLDPFTLAPIKGLF